MTSIKAFEELSIWKEAIWQECTSCGTFCGETWQADPNANASTTMGDNKEGIFVSTNKNDQRQKTCILSSPSAKRARAVNDRQLKPMQWQGQAMIGPGSNKRMVLSWVPVPPILFYKIKVLDETYLWDISGKKSCWRDYNCRAIVNANELLKRRLWPSWTETFHQQCQQMCGKWMKIRILVAAKVKYWIMDALWNPSRAKAKKKLEASEKLNFVTLYTMCTWFCPRSRNKQAGKLQS